MRATHGGIQNKNSRLSDDVIRTRVNIYIGLECYIIRDIVPQQNQDIVHVFQAKFAYNENWIKAQKSF